MRTIESFAKGLRVLEYALLHGEFRIGEMAALVKIPSSNATLFLNTLMEAGLLRRGEVAGLYRVTEHLLSLFDNGGTTLHEPLRRAAEESMRQLHERLNENVLLAVMDVGFTTHYIAKFVADRAVQVQPHADEHYPMHRTAHGKAILAFLPEELIQRHISVDLEDADPPASPRQIAVLMSDLDACRQVGFALNRGEYEEHIMAAAAPVCLKKRVVGSLVVQLPKFRHDESELGRYGKVVAEAAASISSVVTERLS